MKYWQRDHASFVCTCSILCLGQLKDAEAEIAKVMQSRQEAEQQISASKVKMEVLSNYFKDKEKDLMRFVCFKDHTQLFK